MVGLDYHMFFSRSLVSGSATECRSWRRGERDRCTILSSRPSAIGVNYVMDTPFFERKERANDQMLI